ncbi:hypothetical protein BG015_011364 [Linnemannia schmuckeri]|uniref:Uncharacterized protein n=1 Tax=Linnemannia schmuckeri TaxID=64567 RepID=A0A9P5V8J8_9FUNG|nr:hypothetical protein BG015_011364 [Linnemannia schmuckeri]
MNDTFGPLTYACLKEMYFGHLTILSFVGSSGCTSVMVQEVLTECVNLVELVAPYIFMRDIAKATKPWGCRGLYKLAVYIAKEFGEEAEAEEWVFEQIGRMRRLLDLDLSQDPYSLGMLGWTNPFLELEILDLRLTRSRDPCDNDDSDDNGNTGGGSIEDGGNENGRKVGSNIRCWSSLMQMQIFVFDGVGQALGMDEAKWMVEHWQGLRCISGAFKEVEGQNCAWLKRLFVDRDISY